MNRLVIIFAFVSLFLGSAHGGVTFYVDGNLSSNCTVGNYSISTRNCTGSDGDAYTTIAGGIAVITSGDTMNIRAGTYVENQQTLPLINTAYALMVTITGYLSETVTWQNLSLYSTTLTLGNSAGNLTVANINFVG